MTFKSVDYFVLILIFFSGVFLRFYNHSFDDLWYDEVISFWIANPKFTFAESLTYHRLIEVNTFAYHFLLKIIFIMFGYSVEAGRLFSVVFSSLSILSVGYLNWYLSKNKSFFLTFFLISFNIFLISYSQEIRLYSLLFFFASLSLIFFFKTIFEKKNTYLALYFIITLSLVLLHPFALIIIFSYLLYFSWLIVKNKKILYSLIIITFIIIVISTLFYYHSFLLAASSISTEYFWMQNPKLKFLTNFYFSSFFGSRLMGLIFLIIFLSLVTFNIKKIRDQSFLNIMLIIVVLSYAIPLIFGYLFSPILVSRYIIFVLIPIIILISILTFDLSKKFKFIVLAIMFIFTLGNHFTEQTFKQFFRERIVSKPQYTSAVEFIGDSKFTTYTLRVEKMKDNQATIEAINNYIKYINDRKNLNLKFVNLSEELGNEPFWFICFQDINSKHCSLTKKIEKFKILNEHNFNNINLKLIRKF